MRRKAAHGQLPLERIDALNAIDPWWNPPWSLRWQHTYIHILHRLTTTKWSVPYMPDADKDPTWDSWLDRQINHQSSLHSGQRALLHLLATRAGTTAHPHLLLLIRPATRPARTFAIGLRAARQHLQREGHLHVRRGHTESVGFERLRLDCWLDRRHRDAAQLTLQQIDALAALGLPVVPRFLEPGLRSAA